MSHKERQEPWNYPFNRKCSGQPGSGCHERIYDGIISLSKKFCNNRICNNYVEDEEYDIYLEEYYSWREDSDTDYERSDEEKCGKCDRVWIKIKNIKETENSYSGQYMHNHIWKELFDKKIICDDQVEDIRRAIREKFTYNISKLEFNELCETIINVGLENPYYFSLDGWRLDNFFDREAEDKSNKTDE